MAQLSSGRVDIISRENGTLLSQNSTNASRNVLLTEPSVVRINGTRATVASFERQGDDLILHMQDGTVVRYQRFSLMKTVCTVNWCLMTALIRLNMHYSR